MEVLANRAAAHGYKKYSLRSSGEAMFFNKKTKTYISMDNTSHNVSDGWKMFRMRNGKPERMGTYDANLNRIGD